MPACRRKGDKCAGSLLPVPPKDAEWSRLKKGIRHERYYSEWWLIVSGGAKSPSFGKIVLFRFAALLLFVIPLLGQDASPFAASATVKTDAIAALVAVDPTFTVTERGQDFATCQNVV